MSVAMSCKHGGYLMRDGVLVCAQCGEPSQSPKWRGNVYGLKAVEQMETENKGRFWPSESKRGPGRPKKHQ